MASSDNGGAPRDKLEQFDWKKQPLYLSPVNVVSVHTQSPISQIVDLQSRPRDENQAASASDWNDEIGLGYGNVKWFSGD